MTNKEAIKKLRTILSTRNFNWFDMRVLILMSIEALENQKTLQEELEKIKTEIEKIKMKKPLMSKGFECYGFKDKTPEDIKTEVIELLENYISELKGENE